MINFKKFLTEVHTIEVGQAIVAHEPTDKASSSVSNPLIRSEINQRLLIEFNSLIMAPEEGVQKIRKVLHRFGLDLPALYEANRDGDELVFIVNQFQSSQESENFYLYLIYYFKDEGSYDFYAELVDEETLQEIVQDAENDEDEEEETVE